MTKAKKSVKRRNIIFKILVVIIILLPVASWSGCKKQARCGCGKDKVGSLDSLLIDHSSIVYTDSTNAVFRIGYNTYFFCNPVEMYHKYAAMRSNDQMILSGDLFWECQYLMSSSNSYYYQYYKVYQMEVTLLEPYLYGKK